MDTKPDTVLRYRVENDDHVVGSYESLRTANRIAGNEYYVIEVQYVPKRERIVKRPERRLTPEVLQGNWLVADCINVGDYPVPLRSSERISRVELELKEDWKKVHTRYDTQIPELATSIDSIRLVKNKWGARVVGEKPEDTSEWFLFDTREAAVDFLQDIYEVSVK